MLEIELPSADLIRPGSGEEFAARLEAESHLAQQDRWSDYFAGKGLDYLTKADCQWVTMGGKPGADGAGSGGARICIDGSGEIRKGPSGTTGKKPDELSKEPKAPSLDKKPAKEKPKAPSVEKPAMAETPNRDYIGKPIGGKDNEFDPALDIPDFVKLDAQKLIDSLTAKDKQIIEDYTGEPMPEHDGEEGDEAEDERGASFDELNSVMRKCPPDFGCLTPKLKKVKDRLEDIISKTKFKKPTPVYRGVQLKPEVAKVLLDAALACLKEGRSFSMPSVTSTSLDPQVLDTFTSGYQAKSQRTPVVFHIMAKTGLYAESLSKMGGESEVIQSSKTKYNVVSVGKAPVNDKETNVIYLEEV